MLHLKAICLTCLTVEEFVWEISPPVPAQQLLTSSRLVIKANILIAGENYKFNVSVGDGKGFATVEMSTLENIDGKCSIDPSEGMEAQTEFRVDCTGESVTSLHTLFQGDIQLFSSNSPIFTSKLNANDGGVTVRVENLNGQYVVVQLNVQIKETTVLNSIDEIHEIFTSKNESFDLKRIINEETQSNALVFINTIAGRLNNLKPVDVITDIVAQILDLMNELRIDQFVDIAAIAQTMLKLLSSIRMNHKIALKCAKIVDRMSNALKNYDEEVTVSDYVNTTNRLLSVVNQLIDPFETIPPVQNENLLISQEYHTESYAYYEDLDFGIFEKLENLERVTTSIEGIINGLGTCAAKSFHPMEMLEKMTANDLEFKVIALDQEMISNHLEMNGSTIAVRLSKQLLSEFPSESSISCTFFSKNPIWWFSDGNEINSDVVGVSIYETDSAVPHSTKEITKLQLPLQISLDIKNKTQAPQRNEVLNSSVHMSSFKVKCPKNGAIFVNFTQLDAGVSLKIHFTNRSLNSNEMEKENPFVIIDGFNANSLQYNCTMAIETILFLSIVSNEAINTTSGEIKFSFELNTVQCLHWETVTNTWQSDGCSVDVGSSSFDRIHCECNHLSLFAVKYHKSDFCAIFPDYTTVAPMKSVIWICMLFLVVILSVMALWAWRRENLDANNEKLIYLQNEHSQSRSLHTTYAITIVTGNRPKANTTSHVAIKIHGNEYTPKIIPLFDRKFELFQRGSINNFIVNTKRSVGKIQKITLCHDCNGPYPSWYCDAVIIRDLQRNEEWNFDVNRWFSREAEHKEFTASIDLIAEKDYFKRKRLLLLHWKKLLHSSSYTFFSICLRRSDKHLSRVEIVYATFVALIIGLMANLLFFRYNRDENQSIRKILVSAIVGIFTTIVLRVLLVHLLIKTNKMRTRRHWQLMFKPQSI